MLLLLLSLTVLNLALLLLIAWILYQVSGQTAQNQHSLLQIQRNLNSFDQPASLAVGGVAPGTSWVASEAEIHAFQQKMESESHQRMGLAGSMKSKTTSTRRMALPTASSQ